MRWVVKAHTLALLSRLPGGKRLYHASQRVLRTNVLDVSEALERAAQIIDLIREAGGNVAGAACMEVGTGWRPFVPLLLRLAGAERTITFDVNPWLDQRYALETYLAIDRVLPQIAARLGIPLSEVERRHARWNGRPPRMADILTAFHVDYRCPADASATRLPADSVDCVVSSNVLEHVAPDVLAAIHRESFRVLTPGGLAVHRFNPGDHFVSVDRSITGANFLQFSPDQWHWLGGSGLSYHNRLRCTEHEQLLRQSGFALAVARAREDPRAREAIRAGQLTVHAGISDGSRWTS